MTHDFDAPGRSYELWRHTSIGRNESMKGYTYPSSISPFAGMAKPNLDSSWTIVWGVASTASLALSTYHGYKRNNSLGWALWWGLCGALFPVVTPAIALAQGFAKPAK